MNILLLLVRNWRLIGIGALIIGNFVNYGFGYMKGSAHGKEKCQNQIIAENTEKQEELNEIRNAPIDVDDLLERLGNGTF